MKKPYIIIGTVERVLEVISKRITPENPNAEAGETTNDQNYFKIDDDMMVLIPLSEYAKLIGVPFEDMSHDIFLDVWNSLKEISGRFPIRELEVDE